MIIYGVPYLKEYGGIQTFAKTVYSALKQQCRIKIIDWPIYYPTSRIDQLLTITPFLYPVLAKHRLEQSKKRLISQANLVHFWQPLAAIGFKNTNFIVSVHGREILEKNLSSYQENSLKKVFKKTKFIHANSRFTKQLLLKNFPTVDKQKVKVIYPGIKLGRKTVCKKAGKQLTIGTLCRFNPRKNLVNIIKALNILKKKHQFDFKYILIGQGITVEKVSQALKKANFDWQYRKTIADKEKQEQFFGNLDVFVLPTLDLTDDIEGFGIVYLEASQAGVPVVASRVGGAKEAVSKQSGIFVNPQDPVEISQGIYQAIKNRKQYAYSARKWVKRFSLKKSIEELGQLYEQA